MYNNPPFWKQTLKNFRPRRLRRLDTSAFGALLLLNFTSNDATGGMTYICVCIHDVVSYMMAWAQSEVPLWWSESRVYYPSYILVNHVANYIQKHVPRNLENVNNNCARNSRVRSPCPLPHPAYVVDGEDAINVVVAWSIVCFLAVYLFPSSHSLP